VVSYNHVGREAEMREPKMREYEVRVCFTVPMETESAVVAADMVADTVRAWMETEPYGLSEQWFRFTVTNEFGSESEYRLSKNGRIRSA
jgi:hypothetical protein